MTTPADTAAQALAAAIDQADSEAVELLTRIVALDADDAKLQAALDQVNVTVQAYGVRFQAVEGALADLTGRVAALEHPTPPAPPVSVIPAGATWFSTFDEPKPW